MDWLIYLTTGFGIIIMALVLIPVYDKSEWWQLLVKVFITMVTLALYFLTGYLAGVGVL